MKKFYTLLLMALFAINANAAGEAADWYLYIWSDTSNSGGDAAQFKTTDTDGVFTAEGVVISEQGIKFCVRNGSWSSMYGWKDAAVSNTGTAVGLATATGATGWLGVAAGTYDVTWNANDLTIQFDEHTSQTASDWYLYFYSDTYGLNGDAGRFEAAATDGIYTIENLKIENSGFNFCIHDGEWTTRYGYTETYPGSVTAAGAAVQMATTTENTNGWLEVPAGMYNVTLDMTNAGYITIRFDAVVYPAYIVVYANRGDEDVQIGTLSATDRAFGTYAGQIYMGSGEQFWINAVDDDNNWTGLKTNASNAIVAADDEGAYNMWADATAGIHDFVLDFTKATNAWTCINNDAASTYTLTLNETGYASFYTNFAYVVPEGLTGYTVTAIAGGDLTLTEAYTAGSQVPRWTGLVFKGTAGDYTITYNGDLSATATDNLLSGTHEEQDIPSWGENYCYYKLANGEQGLGWYWGASDGGVFTNGAHKVYLAVQKNANIKSFIPLGGNETAISNVQAAADTHSPMYNLAGQRMNAAQLRRGIYIKNGRKFINR